MGIEDHGVSLEVVCQAGYKGDERPIRLQLDGVDHFVDEVLEQWHGPDHAYFTVRTQDGGVYTLRRSTVSTEAGWTLEARRPGRR